MPHRVISLLPRPALLVLSLLGIGLAAWAGPAPPPTGSGRAASPKLSPRDQASWSVYFDSPGQTEAQLDQDSYNFTWSDLAPGETLTDAVVTATLPSGVTASNVILDDPQGVTSPVSYTTSGQTVTFHDPYASFNTLWVSIILAYPAPWETPANQPHTLNFSWTVTMTWSNGVENYSGTTQIAVENAFVSIAHTLSKGSDSKAIPGSLINYTLDASTWIAATSFTIQAIVPTGTTLVANTVGSGTIEGGGTYVQWQGGSGLTDSVTFSVRLNTDVVASNQTSVLFSANVFSFDPHGAASGIGNDTVAIAEAEIALTLVPTPTSTTGAFAGQTIHYAGTAAVTSNTGAKTSTLTLTDTLPNNCTLVAGSAKPAATATSTQLTWTLKNASKTAVQFDVQVDPADQIPFGTHHLTTTLVAQSTMSDGSSGEETVAVAIPLISDLTTEVIDANPRSMQDLLLPNDDAQTALANRSYAVNTRIVKNVAADGVSLLLIRVLIGPPKVVQAKFTLQAVDQDGASLGGLFQVNDTTAASGLIDGTPSGGQRDSLGGDGPDTLTTTLVKSGSDTYAYALYRSPRNFDSITTGMTLTEQNRPIDIHVEALDAQGNELGANDQPLTVVRPLVVLQHGTFDSPEGWIQCPLWTQSGNELKLYEDWNSAFPFQTDRSSFYSVVGGAGHAIPSAQAALQSLNQVFNNWRVSTETAAAQVDLVTHSYGGVVMRLVAQGAVSTSLNPMSVEATSYRSADNWGNGLFHKFISIAATHRGSETGNHLAVLNDQGLVKGLIRDLAANAGKPIDGGAVEDQMVVAPLLRTLQETFVPCHAIVGCGLCDYDIDYATQFAKLWYAAVPGSIYQTGGPVLNADGTPNYTNLRAFTNFAFNLNFFTEVDDTAQTPNYDLTVSSYSMKGSMPRAAYSDVTDLQAFQPPPGESLSGPLTHGDEISMGAGIPDTVYAVANRLVYLLRQPTTSTLFTHFPAVFAAQSTDLEQELSNTTNYNPTWLYQMSILPHLAPTAAAPILSASGVTTQVAAGQQFQVQINWPGETVQSGMVTWTGGTAFQEPFLPLSSGAAGFTVTVSPQQQPGPFSVLAFLTATDGSQAEASLQLQDEDTTAYTTLRVEPVSVTTHSILPLPLNIYGQLPNGNWQYLANSSLLSLSSDNDQVVSINATNQLQPAGVGETTVHVAVAGAGSVPVTVDIIAYPVGVAAVPASANPVWNTKSKKPVEFAFLSTSTFDASQLDPTSIHVNGIAVPAADVTLSDVNHDGLTDAVISILPKDLNLSAGRQALSLLAATKGGSLVAGSLAVTVK